MEIATNHEKKLLLMGRTVIETEMYRELVPSASEKPDVYVH